MFNEDTDNMLLQLQRLTQGGASTAGQMAAQAPTGAAGAGALANIQGRQQAGAAQAQAAAQAAAQQYAQQQAALMKLAMHFFGA